MIVALKMLANDHIGVNKCWSFIAVLELISMWALIFVLEYVPVHELPRHLRRRKQLLLCAASEWTAAPNVLWFRSALNYCRVSLVFKEEYDGITERQTGIERWRQEQQRIYAYSVGKRQKKPYLLMEKCTAIRGWHWFVFIPTRIFPPPDSLSKFEQVCIHRYPSALNRETYEEENWFGRKKQRKHRLVVKPTTLGTSGPPDTTFTLTLCDGGSEVFGTLWDLLLYCLDYRVFGSHVQVVHGMMDLTPCRKCKLQLGHNAIVVPSHPSITTIAALLPLLRS